MKTINARNVNDALVKGYQLMSDKSGYIYEQDSRNGPVLRVPEPVTTVYANPAECVLFDPHRDANPFFHLIENIWMISGRNTLRDLTPYVKRMAQYSDDGGKTQPAAYGHRWRNWFNAGNYGGVVDQVSWALERLRKDPTDRRVVIQMWDGARDPQAADRGSKDVPCNLTVLPWVLDGSLHITVFCRSNDMVMGAYGANASHFAFLLQYMAAQLELVVGTYTQISNNFHMYVNDAGVDLDTWSPAQDPYADGTVRPRYLTQTAGGMPHEKVILQDLGIFFDQGAFVAATKARWDWLRLVACPVALAHKHYRETKGDDRYLGALEILEHCLASDWHRACTAWIQRRRARWLAAQDDGVSHGPG